MESWKNEFGVPQFLFDGSGGAKQNCWTTPVIATIAVIDDDDAVRDSTCALLISLDYEVRDHPSAEHYLSQARRFGHLIAPASLEVGREG